MCGWFRISPPITATLANEVFVLFSNADSTSIESSFESGEMLLGARGAKWTIGPGGNKLQTDRLELIAYGQRLSEPVVIANLARQEPFFVCAHAGVNPQAAIPLGEVWLVRQNSTKVLTKSIHWWPSTFSVQVAMRVYVSLFSSFLKCRPMAVGGPLRFASGSALRSVSGHVDSVFGSSSMITESGALQMATKNADLWKQLCIDMPRRDFAKDQCGLPRAQRFDRAAFEPLIRGSAASSNSTDGPATTMVTSATSTSSPFVSQTLPASIKSSVDTLVSVAAAVVEPTPVDNTIAITFFALAGIVCIAAIALLIASQRESLNRI